MSDLIFFVNGKKIIKANPNPRTLLAEYLRLELKLTGTKIACGEGGCGACTVLVSKFDRSQSKILHYPLNSCITPLCSVHGCAVTTVEAVGSLRSKLHPIQERLVNNHGIQCGFCSPGMVMSMFALLRNNPQPSEQQIEHAIKGNLCRCTGYRPILDAFNSFAKDKNVCPLGALCCQNKTKQEISTDCVSSDKLSGEESCDVSQELIFPNELQLSDELDRTNLTFGSSESGLTWYRPVSLAELLSLRKKYPDAVLSAGSTAIVFTLKRLTVDKKPLVILSTSGVQQLARFEQNDNELFIGALTSMTRLETILDDLAGKLSAPKNRLLVAASNMLKVFGSPQIRNAATVGGSLALASPSADLNAVFLVSSCTVEVASLDGKRQVAMANFFNGNRDTNVNKDEVIVGIRVPFTAENEYFASFKQSQRQDLNQADITAAIGLKLNADNETIEELSLSVGGLKLSALKLINSVKTVIGRKWNRQVLETLQLEIFNEIKCESPNDEINRYRLLSLQGFLLRFYLEMCEKLSKKQELTESDALYLDLSSKAAAAVHSGVSNYNIEQPTADTDSVGQPITHRWAKQCATGEAVFTDDILPSEGELYVSLVGSSKANARILSVDPSAALAVPGVVGYLDHKSIPGKNRTGFLEKFEIFAVEQVHHYGQSIGAVVADSMQVARFAASLVKVDYEELPAILTIEDAIKHNSYHQFHPGMGHLKRGDLEAGFKSATHVIESELRVGGQEHFYMETNCARVVPSGEDGEMDVYVGAQGTTTCQEAVADALNVSANKITVHIKRMGGAFGGKEFKTTTVTLPSALAAYKYGRPARSVLNRNEDMQRTGHRRPYLFKYKIGFTDSGLIVAVDADIYANDGFFSELAFLLMNQTLLYSDNCYSIPNVDIRGHMCKTNLQPRCAMRGAGVPQGVLFCEHLIRKVAHHLDVPVLQIQQLNMIQSGQLTTGNVPIEATLDRCFKDVLKQSDYEEEYLKVQEFNKKSKHIKRGIAIVPLRFSPTIPMPWMQGGALVHIYLDGSVLLTHGGVECGQGLHTKMVQVASRALEAPIDIIHLSEVSTNTVPNTSVTGGSSGSDINGMAVMNACATLSERLKPFKVAKPDGSWKDWVLAAYNNGVSLSCAGFWRSSFDAKFDMSTNEGQAYSYFTYGAGVTQVELDCLTGHFTIPRVDIVMDIGKSLNPAIDVGQIEGAFVMGLGLFTLERHEYNERGAVETVGAGKYHVPSVSSVPLAMNVTLLKDAANPQAVYSSKGIGEPPLLASCSVFFALQEAIKAARVDVGLKPQFKLNSPATVDQILLAMHAADQ